MSRSSSSSNQPRSGPFLHLKFGTGRPPEYATRHLFAHEVMKAPPDTLPEGLRTDVQREGIGRYLVNNFKDGSPVHAVVRAREGDEGIFILVTQNWHRSSGDPKLHLSLYVYKSDRHVETWHAYTDRSLSLTNPNSQDGPSAYETPAEARKVLPSYAPKPSRDNNQDDSRHRRLDRPAAAPPSASTDRDEATSDDSSSEGEDQPQPPRSRSSRQRSAVPSRQAEPPSARPVARAHEEPQQPRRERPYLKEDRPVSPARDDWDEPPPEQDHLSDDWIRPPEEAPVEGFEKMFEPSQSASRRSEVSPARHSERNVSPTRNRERNEDYHRRSHRHRDQDESSRNAVGSRNDTRDRSRMQDLSESESETEYEVERHQPRRTFDQRIERDRDQSRRHPREHESIESARSKAPRNTVDRRREQDSAFKHRDEASQSMHRMSDSRSKSKYDDSDSEVESDEEQVRSRSEPPPRKAVPTKGQVVESDFQESDSEQEPPELVRQRDRRTRRPEPQRKDSRFAKEPDSHRSDPAAKSRSRRASISQVQPPSRRDVVDSESEADDRQISHRETDGWSARDRQDSKQNPRLDLDLDSHGMDRSRRPERRHEVNDDSEEDAKHRRRKDRRSIQPLSDDESLDDGRTTSRHKPIRKKESRIREPDFPTKRDRMPLDDAESDSEDAPAGDRRRQQPDVEPPRIKEGEAAPPRKSTKRSSSRPRQPSPPPSPIPVVRPRREIKVDAPSDRSEASREEPFSTRNLKAGHSVDKGAPPQTPTGFASFFQNVSKAVSGMTKTKDQPVSSQDQPADAEDEDEEARRQRKEEKRRRRKERERRRREQEDQDRMREADEDQRKTTSRSKNRDERSSDEEPRGTRNTRKTESNRRDHVDTDNEDDRRADRRKKGKQRAVSPEPEPAPEPRPARRRANSLSASFANFGAQVASTVTDTVKTISSKAEAARVEAEAKRLEAEKQLIEERKALEQEKERLREEKHARREERRRRRAQEDKQLDRERKTRESKSSLAELQRAEEETEAVPRPKIPSRKGSTFVDNPVEARNVQPEQGKLRNRKSESDFETAEDCVAKANARVNSKTVSPSAIEKPALRPPPRSEIDVESSESDLGIPSLRARWRANSISYGFATDAEDDLGPGPRSAFASSPVPTRPSAFGSRRGPDSLNHDGRASTLSATDSVRRTYAEPPSRDDIGRPPRTSRDDRAIPSNFNFDSSSDEEPARTPARGWVKSSDYSRFDDKRSLAREPEPFEQDVDSTTTEDEAMPPRSAISRQAPRRSTSVSTDLSLDDGVLPSFSHKSTAASNYNTSMLSSKYGPVGSHHQQDSQTYSTDFNSRPPRSARSGPGPSFADASNLSPPKSARSTRGPTFSNYNGYVNEEPDSEGEQDLPPKSARSSRAPSVRSFTRTARDDTDLFDEDAGFDKAKTHGRHSSSQSHAHADRGRRGAFSPYGTSTDRFLPTTYDSESDEEESRHGLGRMGEGRQRGYYYND